MSGEERSGYGFSLEREFEAREDVERKHLVYGFKGPGLSRYASVVVVWREHDAETVARLLALAFEAGKCHQKEEIRAALGIHNTPWGVKVGGR